MEENYLYQLAELVLHSELLRYFLIVKIEQSPTLFRIHLDERMEKELSDDVHFESKGSCRICIRPICFVSLHWQGKRDGVSLFSCPIPQKAPQSPKDGFSILPREGQFGPNGFVKGPLSFSDSGRMNSQVWPFRNVVWANERDITNGYEGCHKKPCKAFLKSLIVRYMETSPSLRKRKVSCWTKAE